MRSLRPQLPLPWLPLPWLLLGLSLLAGGCSSTRYSVHGGYAPALGLANESTMAAPLKESYPSALQLGRVLLVVPNAQASQFWHSGAPRRVAVEALLAEYGASLGEVASGALPLEDLRQRANLKDCPTILTLEAFEWAEAGSRYFAELGGPTLGDVPREAFDALPLEVPHWQLRLGEEARLLVLGTLQVTHEGKLATLATFQFRLNLAYMPYPEGYGAIVEGSGADLDLVSESARHEVFGQAARENAERYALMNLLRFAAGK